MLKNNKIYIFTTAVFLLFLCLITYGDTLTHHFMIDDHNYINPTGNLLAFYRHLEDFFRKSFDQHYIPFNFLLNVVLFQSFHKPLPLYLVNLFLFYINCLSLFVFIYLISNEFMVALLTCIVFIIHPMTGDILQHITFNILLVQIILIESGLILLYLYFKKNGHILYYFFSFFAVFLALLCQETTLLFPLYATALLFFLTDFKLSKIIKISVPFIFLDIIFIAVWLLLVNPREHLESVKTLQPTFLAATVANFSRLFFWYLSNLFVPRNIVFMCNMPPLTGFIWLWNILLFGFLTGCGLFICRYSKKSLESFALVLFLIGFVYAFGASQVRFRNEGYWEFEPNWLYFSSIGFYLFMALVLLKLRKHIKKWLFLVLLVAVFISYFLSTVGIDIISRTEAGYCENWLRKFPGNTMAKFPVADFYRHNKNIEIPADFIPDMLDTVDVYIKNDFPQRASELMERISSSKISLVQRNELSYKLAAYHCKDGHQDQCEESVVRIIGSQKDPQAYMQLSYAFDKAGADKTAIILLGQCINLYPSYKEPYLLTGVILANEGHYEESIHFWKQGLAIDPADQRFISNIDQAKALINKK